MQREALYYIPPGPDVRELKPHERPTLGMIPPYAQTLVRTFETACHYDARRGSSSSSSSTSSSETGGAARRRDRAHRRRNHKAQRGRSTSCASSCNRSLSIASMGSNASLTSSVFSTAAAYDEYVRDRHHLRKYIGSGGADTASLRHAIDSYWNRYGPKGCVDRRLPHSPHCRHGRRSRPCRCSPNCICRGGRRRECDYSARGCPVHGQRGRHGRPSSFDYQPLQDHHRSRYRKERPSLDRYGDRRTRDEAVDGGVPTRRTDGDRASSYDDPHAPQKSPHRSGRRVQKRGQRRLLPSRDDSYLADSERKQRYDSRGSARSVERRRASDDYVIVMGKNITHLIHPRDRAHLARKSGLDGGASPRHKPRRQPPRAKPTSPPRSAEGESFQGQPPDLAPASPGNWEERGPPPAPLLTDQPPAPPPAAPMAPPTAPPPAALPVPTTAAAAVGVQHTLSPTNSASYYHFFSGLPAAKMNSFAPPQATKIVRPETSASRRGQPGVHPAVDSVGISTVGVDLD